ncbi:response regulator [Marinilabiliaceae bacterium JC017]|nr:response regulator [Marinilabiliaceae bacterium JC017]
MTRPDAKIRGTLFKQSGLLLLVLFINSVFVAAQRTPAQEQFIEKLNLSATEKEWLDQNYVVRVHPDTWPPFNYWDIKTGTNQGICVEYLRWIGEQTGIDFEYPSMWMPLKHILPALESKQLDMSPSLQKTEERENYLIFTQKIHQETFSLFGGAKKGKGKFTLQTPGLRVSTEEGSRTYHYLKQHYPYITIIPTTTEEDGLRKVISHEADFHAGATSVCNYLIKNYYGLKDLTAVQKLNYKSQGIYMAVRNDWPELTAILNKSLDNMPASLKQEITDSYLHKIDWNKYKTQLFWVMVSLVFVLSIISLLLKKSIQKQKEQKKILEKNELKLQQASEMARLHFMEYHIEQQTLQVSSKSAFYFTGNSKHTTLSLKSCYKLVFPEDLGIIKRTIRSYAPGKDDAIKFRVNHPSGALIHLNCFINRDVNHNPKSPRLLLSCLDISQEVLYNSHLLSTQRLAHIGHFRFERSSHQYYLSDEAKNILEIDTNTRVFSPLNLIRLVPHKNLHSTIDKIKQAVKNQEQEFKTTLEVNRRGQVFHLHFISRFFFNNKGKVIMHDGYLQDITELKKTEKLLKEAKNLAEKANKSKSIFLARMSHEIRTPLSVVIGMLNLTLKTRLNQKQNNYLQKTKTASNLLLNLINDILDFSKIEANKTTLNHQHFNLLNCLEDLQDMLNAKAREKGLNITFDIPATIPQWVYADQLRLKQVLINLINNAIKFTHEGTIKVTIEELAHSNGEIALQFSVTDTGIGIQPDKLKLLFQSFMQVDESFVRQYEGTGLGLAISKRIVELWGGKIWVESIYGKGSTFHFTFKAKPGDQKIGDDLDATNGKKIIKLVKQPKVLLAEDNLFNQEIAIEILKETGINVEVVDNGLKAFKAIASNNYDIVFMDIHMPVADGITATRLIRQKLQNTQIPIIAVTAYALTENKRFCLDAGMNDFITKPFVGEDITRIMMHWLPDFCTVTDQPITTGNTITNTCTNKNPKPLLQINLDQARKFFGTNLEKYPQYLEIFRTSCPERHQTISRLIFEEGEDELRSLAHNIKGEAGYLGLEKLHKICSIVNTKIDTTNRVKMARALANTLVQTHEAIKQTIDQLKQNSTK